MSPDIQFCALALSINLSDFTQNDLLKYLIILGENCNLLTNEFYYPKKIFSLFFGKYIKNNLLCISLTKLVNQKQDH
jgi:hypothetical protein